MSNTSEQYNSIIKICSDIFTKKMKDYGSAWRILRTSSLTDQIFIKAKRIRSIEEKGMSKVDEGIRPEYIGIVNYCIMALVQLELGHDENTELDYDKCVTLYEKHFLATKSLMEDKNHDYDEAWRDMRLSSLTDLILMKLLRTKQIEDNDGKTLISEGIDANYQDMINYAVFALIKIEEER
jgi:Nucleotide modification associated domain 1